MVYQTQQNSVQQANLFTWKFEDFQKSVIHV